MEPQDVIFFSVIAAIVLIYWAGLWKIFEKAGEKGWKAVIPVYNTLTILKIIGKKPTKIFLLLIPGVNIVFMIFGVLQELYRSFGKEKFYQQLLGIFFYFGFVAYLGFSREEKYLGPASAIPRPPKSQVREWADAIVFAMVAATIIRWMLMDPYKIPTPSMESTLLMGDFLFVSKVHYGARTPQTPLQVPLTHQTWWGSKTARSYVDWIRLPQYRLPHFSEIKNNDVVVFNWPADPDFKPVDIKTNYIKRCLAIPGDTFRISERKIFINGRYVPNPPKAQYKYKVYTQEPISSKVLNKYAIPNYLGEAGDFRLYYGPLDGEGRTRGYLMDLSPEVAQELAEKGIADSVAIITRKDPLPGETSFPSTGMRWTIDDYGPLWIPKKGSTIRLDSRNVLFYGNTIGLYEDHPKVEIVSGEDQASSYYKVFNKGEEDRNRSISTGTNPAQNLKLLIDGKEINEYTFKRNYYFMVGDNRHSSYDSRFWGFVPDNYIVGKALFVWFSVDQDPKRRLSEAIRWERIFKGIR